MILFLSPHLQPFFSQNSHRCFEEMMAQTGQSYRALENRHTQQIMLANQYYFIKQHFGIGWKEIFKNLFQLRLPILSAKNEWQAIQKARQLKINTLEIEGYGVRGINPARRQSFLITQALTNTTSLEDVCRDWKKRPPTFSFKLFLIKEVARIARTLHNNGINHRDFYICHFLLDNSQQKLYLIDLHRAQIRHKTPLRWIIKDLAGLLFSSQDIGLTKRDCWRFMREYRQKPLRDIFNVDSKFWGKVKARVKKAPPQS